MWRVITCKFWKSLFWHQTTERGLKSLDNRHGTIRGAYLLNFRENSEV
jgi:hypothetical protein